MDERDRVRVERETKIQGFNAHTNIVMKKKEIIFSFICYSKANSINPQNNLLVSRPSTRILLTSILGSTLTLIGEMGISFSPNKTLIQCIPGNLGV
jgi:hypothetical protein